MTAIAAILLLMLILYVIKIRYYQYKWEQYPEFKSNSNAVTAEISVIVAFRNEITSLDALLNSLNSQVYPSDSFEVILVNDHSEDGSDMLAQRFCEEHRNFRLLHNDKALSGKKSAVMKGVKCASCELIVTTDADCTLHEHWLSTIACIYREKNADMIVGLVDMVPDKGFFSGFQEIEFLSLVAAGAGAIAGDHPLYCNGACFAYRKSAFLALTDPLVQHIASGDDTLFLHKLKQDKTRSIVLLKAVPAIVTTRGASTLHEFLQQRKRWVSKSPYYHDFDTLYTGMLVFLVSLSLLFSMILLTAGLNVWLFPLIYSVKMVTDLYFLRNFLRFYGKNLPFLPFMLYELVYPFYVVYLAIAGISSGFDWKGRRY